MNIAERLRAIYPTHPTIMEAVGVIERLEAEREAAIVVQRNASGALDDMRQEIERLTAARDDAEKYMFVGNGQGQGRRGRDQAAARVR